MNKAPLPHPTKAEKVILVALSAGKQLELRLAALKQALEGGHNDEALRIAREVTHARDRNNV